MGKLRSRRSTRTTVEARDTVPSSRSPEDSEQEGVFDHATIDPNQIQGIELGSFVAEELRRRVLMAYPEAGNGRRGPLRSLQAISGDSSTVAASEFPKVEKF